MSHYTNYVVEMQDVEDAQPVVVGSMTETTTPIDNDIQQSETAGTFYPEFVSVAAVNPRSTFSTFDLPKILDYLGLTGLNLQEDAGPPAKVGYAVYQAHYDNGFRQPTGHRRLRFPKSYAMARAINVAHRQDATIDVETMAIWDGSAQDPLLIEENQALPVTQPPRLEARWTLAGNNAGVIIGGVLIPCVTDLSIDFGVNPTIFGCDSDIHDSHLNLDSIQPVISITCLDITAFAAGKATLLGLCGTHLNTWIHLQKRKECGAGFVDGTVAEHIRMTADGVLNVTDAHSATGNQRAQITFQLTCTWDGTNAPIIFDTQSTIGVPT